MSFENIEFSQDLGAPFELYEFRFGDTVDAVYRYTNFDRDLERLGHLWHARPITREAYRATGKNDDKSLTITMPVDTDLSALFTDFPPTQVVTVTIRAGHMSDPDEQILVIWLGRVLTVAKEGNRTTLTCDNTTVSMRRPGLRRNWQYACPYILYGEQCRAVQRPQPATVLAISTSGVVLSENWWGIYPPEKYRGGMIRWRSPYGWEFRTIRTVDMESRRITFVGPFRDLEVGQQVQMIVGCNRTMDDCEHVHDNINNYGGQPWIPLKNPVRYHPFW